MRYWIKKGALLLGGLTFFIILIINLLSGSDLLEIEFLVPALIRAFIGGSLFWFAGFIIGDIILKGVLNDIDEHDMESTIDGGLVQQVQIEKGKHVPGGEEYPFIEEKVTYQRMQKKKKK